MKSPSNHCTQQAADDLLSGKVEHRIVGDTVQFEYDEDKYRQPATAS